MNLAAVQIVKASPRNAYALSVLTREYFDYAQLSQDKILERLRSNGFEYWLARAGGKLAGFIDVDFTPIQGLRNADGNAPQGNAPGFLVEAAASAPQAPNTAFGARVGRGAKRKGTPKAKQAKILGLAVLPEFRGRGIAKKLIAKAVSRANARGCREVFLLVREDNAAAQRLYAAIGFELRGALAEKMWGQRILLYAKELKKK